MRQALAEARYAAASGEIPIGAVVAEANGASYEILGRGYNRNIELQRHTAHAELVALDNASDRLIARAAEKIPPSQFSVLDRPGIVLVSTLEPCIMCYSACILSNIETVVYGLRSPADGGPGRVSMVTKPNVREPTVMKGILAEETRELFVEWLNEYRGERHRPFVEQLLTLTVAL
jgi:tRNA(adenine34) deaminase